MPYYAIPGENASLFVDGNCVESKYYFMEEIDGVFKAWEKDRNCLVKHIYTIDHAKKTISFGPDFEQVYVWCIGNRFPCRPVLFKIEPPKNP